MVKSTYVTPTMRAEVHYFVQTCMECQLRPPKPYATLFQIAIAPNWSRYIVDYLQHRRLPEKVKKVRSKDIELESKDYELIANQLYKREKDKQLRRVHHRIEICTSAGTSSS